MLPAYFQALVLQEIFIVMEQKIAIYVKLVFHMILLKTVYNIV